MANRRSNNIAKGARILAGSFGATEKYGFGGNYGQPITSAPKSSSQWFVNLRGPNGMFDEFAEKVRNVSEISLTVEHETIDQYGKRIKVPTRVNFPDVTISFYDTVDGKIFKMVEQIYSTYFKNNNADVTEGGVDREILNTINSGIKFRDTSGGNYYNHFFKIITLYHFFGDIDGTGNGSGQIQKIDIVNPLVTNITFSESDYSSDDLRMITLTLAPENIVIKSENVSATSPNWMNLGLEYVTEFLSSSASNGWKTMDISAVVDIENKINSLIKENTNNFSVVNTSSSPEERLMEQSVLQNNFSTDVNVQDILKDKISNTMDLFKTSGFVAGTEESFGNKKISNNFSSLSSTDYELVFEDIVSQLQNNNFSAYPDVWDFANLGSQDGGTDVFTRNDLNNIIKRELIDSIFNGTGFSLKRILGRAAQAQLGNTGIGMFSTMPKTATSRFGIGGDIIRDRISNAIINTDTNTGMSFPIKTSTENISKRDNTAISINTLRNKTRGIR